MKIGILTTTHVRSNAALGSLRLLLDSVHAEVPATSYEHTLVVDDCSPPAQVDPYYTELASNGVDVWRLGPERIPHWGPKHGMLPPAGETTSFGHAYGLMAGFWRLRQLGLTHAWVIDSDCIVLDGGCLDRAATLMQRTGAVVATDYFGGSRADADQVVDNVHHTTGTKQTDKSTYPHHASWALYGFPVLFCALVDLQREPLYGPFHNAGWVNSKWGYRLFRQGGKVAYYPFFQGSEVFHLGFGFTSSNINQNQTFGNVPETRIYGGKERGYHHAGWLQLDRPHAEHKAWLEAIATNPVEVRCPKNPVSHWLRQPKHTEPPVMEDRRVRPLRADDLDQLTAIDSDPGTTQFLSWGPHGRERTQAFVAQAVAARASERWWALADKNDKLIGFGEIRRLNEPSERATGVVYVVAPAHRRQGHGFFLFSELLGAATAQLDSDCCVVAIDTKNTASMRTLEKCGDFKTDWVHLRTEDYTLKGAQAQRAVFCRRYPIIPELPATTLEECVADRERFLFGNLKMWRPT